MHKKKGCEYCEKIIKKLESQVQELNKKYQWIIKAIEVPPNATILDGKKDNSIESFLLEEEEKDYKEIVIPMIGEEISRIKSKIYHFEIETVPTLKTQISMLTKVAQYLDEKPSKTTISEPFFPSQELEKERQKNQSLLSKYGLCQNLKKQFSPP